MTERGPEEASPGAQRSAHPLLTGTPRGVRLSISALLLVFALAIVAIQLWALFWQPHPSDVPYFGDLGIYRSAVSYWLSGGQLYDYVYVNPHLPTPLGFTYPPFAALILIPIVWLPMRAVAAIWTGGTYLVVAAMGVLVANQSAARRACGQRLATDPTRNVALGSLTAALLLLSYPVFHDLGVGQISVALTALALLDATGVVPRRAQGALVGLTGAVKLTPLVFIPYFLVTRQLRQAALASGTFLAATALAFAAAPDASVSYWGREVLDTSRVGQTAWPRNKSLMGLLARLGASGHLLLLLWLALGLSVAALSLFQARRHHVRGENFEAALVIGALSVVVSPISWSHHQTWAVLAAIWLVLTRPGFPRVLGLALLAIFSLVSPFAGLQEPQNWAMRVGDEVPVLAFIGIAALGLGRGRPRGR